MLNFQDLPDELILRILSYSETKDLITYGQVSKRIRGISHDSTLWATANLEKKIVKTELLEMILQKGCRILNLCHSKIIGTLRSNIISQLRVLTFSQPAAPWTGNKTIVILETLLFSCCSLQRLAMEGVFLTPKMSISICKNGKTLQILKLNNSDLYVLQKRGNNKAIWGNNSFQEIIKCCQELKEVDLSDVNNTKARKGISWDLDFLVKNITPNVEKLNLSGTLVIDNDLKILLSRCKKIKALSLDYIKDDRQAHEEIQVMIHNRPHLMINLS